MSPQKDTQQPELLHMRTFRVDARSKALPPILQIDELLSPTMDFKGGQTHHLNMVDRQNGSQSPILQSYRSPIPKSFSDGLVSLPATPKTPDTVDPGQDTPIDAHSQQWSSAVGRATIGKSGRVIEKLQAEADRYKRDLKLETLRREEAQRREELANGSMESLKATNQLLLERQEADRATLARKERKICELKEDLGAERTRRERAERQLGEVSKERNETVNRATQEVAEERERALKATSQYAILANSWKQLDDGYKKSTKSLQADLKQVTVSRQADAHNMERLGVVVSQLRQELDKCKKGKDAIEKLFEDYKQTSDSETRDMKNRAARNEHENARLLSEMTRVLGEMRYTINVSKHVRDIDQLAG